MIYFVGDSDFSKLQFSSITYALKITIFLADLHIEWCTLFIAWTWVPTLLYIYPMRCLPIWEICKLCKRKGANSARIKVANIKLVFQVRNPIGTVCCYSNGDSYWSEPPRRVGGVWGRGGADTEPGDTPLIPVIHDARFWYHARIGQTT